MLRIGLAGARASTRTTTTGCAPPRTHLPLSSRRTLVSFLNDAHNEVNRRTGKREWTLEEHYAAYQKRPAKEESVIPLLVAGTSLLVAAVLYARREKQRRVTQP